MAHSFDFISTSNLQHNEVRALA